MSKLQGIGPFYLACFACEEEMPPSRSPLCAHCRSDRDVAFGPLADVPSKAAFGPLAGESP